MRPPERDRRAPVPPRPDLPEDEEMVGSIDPDARYSVGPNGVTDRRIVWNSRVGSHLGQCPPRVQRTGRTYGCKRADPSADSSCKQGRLQRLGHVRLRDGHLTGGAGHRAVLGHGDEVADLSKRKSHGRRPPSSCGRCRSFDASSLARGMRHGGSERDQSEQIGDADHDDHRDEDSLAPTPKPSPLAALLFALHH